MLCLAGWRASGSVWRDISLRARIPASISLLLQCQHLWSASIKLLVNIARMRDLLDYDEYVYSRLAQFPGYFTGYSPRYIPVFGVVPESFPDQFWQYWSHQIKSNLHAGGKIDTLVRSVEIRIDCARVVSDQFSPRLSEQINISTSTAESAEVKRKHMDRQRMISTDSNNMKFYKSYLTNSGHFLFLSFSSFFFYSASTSLVANHNSVRGLDRRSVSRLVCL